MIIRGQIRKSREPSLQTEISEIRATKERGLMRGAALLLPPSHRVGRDYACACCM